MGKGKAGRRFAESTYHRGIDESVLKVGIAGQQLLTQERSIADVPEEGEVKAVRGR